MSMGSKVKSVGEINGANKKALLHKSVVKQPRSDIDRPVTKIITAIEFNIVKFNHV